MKQAHIQLSSELNITRAILPGDPARVDRIAQFLDNVEPLTFNREYKSVRGTYKGFPILAMSTGMGGASMGIAVEELKNIGITSIVRVGSCGALQKGIALGDLVIATSCVRDDGASKAYVESVYPATANFEILSSCVESAKKLGFMHHVGIVRSNDSFYIDNEEAICEHWSKFGVLGSDMETSALFTIAAIRGVKAASILNNVVLFKEDVGNSIASYADSESATMEGEKKEILVALEALVLQG